jgi:hypothetical protein
MVFHLCLEVPSLNLGWDTITVSEFWSLSLPVTAHAGGGVSNYATTTSFSTVSSIRYYTVRDSNSLSVGIRIPSDLLAFPPFQSFVFFIRSFNLELQVTGFEPVACRRGCKFAKYSIVWNGCLFSGRNSGYGGTGTKSDLDNHSNQGNPNNPKYQGKK